MATDLTKDSNSPKKPDTDWSALLRDETAKTHAQEKSDYENKLKVYADKYAAVSAQLEVALAVKSHAIKIKPVVASSVKDSEATAVVLCSDWHAEEHIAAETVNGLNEFTMEIAKSRIHKLTRSILRLVEIERNGTRIDTLVLALLGDLMTGYIHEELQEGNEASPVQTIVWLRDVILSMIETLKREGKFKRIIIPCCYGNHGRTTRKPRHATAAANSYEWLLYQILAKHCPDVEWHIAESYHTYLSIYGKTHRFHHGDGLRYEGGIGGLTIPVEKAIAAWNKGIVADCDYFGHWHAQQQNPKWCSNGSLIGYGPFSLAIKAPFEPPQQTFLLLDSKRGRTGTWPIFLQ